MKVGIAPEYTAKAKNRALNDLASGISSTVSSTSVLHKIENSYGGTEAFTQQIKVQTDEYLEGFEPADVYETEDRYWVYYRIDKETYRRKKAERKRKTIQTAADKQKEAYKYEQEGNVLGALKGYIQALAILKQYLGESCMAEVNGEQTELGSYLLGRIEQIRNDIRIEAAKDQMKFKRHQINENPVYFKVTYRDKMLGGVPVKLHYTGGYLKRDDVYASKSARVVAIIASTSPNLEHNKLTAELNWPEMVQNANTDLSIRRLLDPMSMPETTVKIITTPPILALSVEQSDTFKKYGFEVQSKFQQLLQDKNFEFTNNPKSADFIVEVKYALAPGESAGGLTSFYCSGQHKLIDDSGKVIAQKSSSKERGVGETDSIARKNALEAFFNNAFRRYISDLLEQI